jgi:glutathione S-transferase
VPKVKLHRCPLTFLKVPGHACHRVEQALEAQGVEYERVTVPISKGKRDEVNRLTHKRLVPVIEFEDGTAYREQSKDMAARIRAGKLFAGAATEAE